MKKEVLTQEEIYAEIRKYRMLYVDQVEAVVMELNGELTVIKKLMGLAILRLKTLKTPDQPAGLANNPNWKDEKKNMS